MRRRDDATSLAFTVAGAALFLAAMGVLSLRDPAAPAADQFAVTVPAPVTAIAEYAEPDPSAPVLRLGTDPVESLTPETMLAPTSVLPPPAPSGIGGLPFAPAGFDACETMEFYRRQFDLPDRFGDSGRHQVWVASDGLGWRETKCGLDMVSPNGCCAGYWQLNVAEHRRRSDVMRLRYEACGIFTIHDIDENTPLEQQRAACGARALFDVAGLSPWRPL